MMWNRQDFIKTLDIALRVHLGNVERGQRQPPPPHASAFAARPGPSATGHMSQEKRTKNRTNLWVDPFDGVWTYTPATSAPTEHRDDDSFPRWTPVYE